MLKQVVKCMCYLPVHTNYVFIILNKIKKLNKEATIKNTNVSYDFMYRTGIFYFKLNGIDAINNKKLRII
jgi:hypothetical protein